MSSATATTARARRSSRAILTRAWPRRTSSSRSATSPTCRTPCRSSRTPWSRSGRETGSRSGRRRRCRSSPAAASPPRWRCPSRTSASSCRTWAAGSAASASSTTRPTWQRWPAPPGARCGWCSRAARSSSPPTTAARDMVIELETGVRSGRHARRPPRPAGPRQRRLLRRCAVLPADGGDARRPARTRSRTSTSTPAWSTRTPALRLDPRPDRAAGVLGARAAHGRGGRALGMDPVELRRRNIDRERRRGPDPAGVRGHRRRGDAGAGGRADRLRQGAARGRGDRRRLSAGGRRSASPPAPT